LSLLAKRIKLLVFRETHTHILSEPVHEEWFQNSTIIDKAHIRNHSIQHYCMEKMWHTSKSIVFNIFVWKNMALIEKHSIQHFC